MQFWSWLVVIGSAGPSFSKEIQIFDSTEAKSSCSGCSIPRGANLPKFAFHFMGQSSQSMGNQNRQVGERS